MKIRLSLHDWLVSSSSVWVVDAEFESSLSQTLPWDQSKSVLTLGPRLPPLKYAFLPSFVPQSTVLAHGGGGCVHPRSRPGNSHCGFPPGESTWDACVCV